MKRSGIAIRVKGIVCRKFYFPTGQLHSQFRQNLMAFTDFENPTGTCSLASSLFFLI
jgi:hypothetical protein